MDNKKIVAVSVLAVLALAFAGAGYASITATTYNAGNDLDVKYITVEPSGWTALTGDATALEFDSYTYNEKTVDAQPGTEKKYLYTLQDQSAAPNNDGETLFGEGFYAYALDDSYTLKISSGSDADLATKLTVSTVDGGSANIVDGKYMLALVVNGELDKAVIATATGFSGDFDVAAGEVSVAIYVGIYYGAEMPANSIPGITSATPGNDAEPPAGKLLNNVTLKFQVTDA